MTSREIVGYADLVPHAVSMILLEQKTSTSSFNSQVTQIQHSLEMLITVKICTVLNPATLLPTADDGQPQDCSVLQ